MQSFKLSVITINRNNAEGLRKTMQSVLDQTSDDFEYIIIDGSSTDGSVDVIKEFLENHQNASKITYWVSEPDTGIYNAMNKGVEKATGKFCLFLNSGDNLHDATVIYDTIPLLNEYKIVYGIANMIDKTPYLWKVNVSRLTFEYFTDTTIPHETAFIPKDLLDKIGGYHENFKIISDWAFFLDARCKFNTKFELYDRIITDFDCTGISANPDFNKQKEDAKRKYLEDNYKPYLDVVDKYNSFEFAGNFSELSGIELLRINKKIQKLILSKLFRKIVKCGK